MEILVEKKSQLERSLSIVISESKLKEKIDLKLEEVRKTANLDGFRKGKVPTKVIVQRFGRQVRNDVVNEVLQQSFGEAVDKENLRPAGQPTISDLKSDKGLTYTADFEVFPTFSLTEMTELKLIKPECEIKEQDVDSVIEKLKKQAIEWKERDENAKAKLDDKLSIKYSGTIDGEVFDGGSGDDENLVLGSGKMIEGFEAGLVDISKGEEKELNLKFPEDYRKTDLAGKTVKFEITVQSISKPISPEMNEEFFKKLGIKASNMTEFREEIKQKLTFESDSAVERLFAKNVIDKLTEKNHFTVPNSLIEAELKSSKDRLMQKWFMKGKNPKDEEEKFEKELRGESETRVRSGLIMAEIIKTAEIKVSPEKIREEIEKAASGYDDPAAVTKWYYENTEQLQAIESKCLEELVIDWVAGQAQLVTEEISFDDLMDPMRTI